MEREFADREARGSGDFDGATPRELVDWYGREIGRANRAPLPGLLSVTRLSYELRLVVNSLKDHPH